MNTKHTVAVDRPLVAFLALGLALAALINAMSAGPVAAQAEPGQLALAGQTIVVNDREATVDVNIISQIDDRRLEVKLFAPITEAAELRDWFIDPATEGFLGQFSVTSVADQDVSGGATVQITIPDDELGEILRRSPGALPVIIELLEDGAVVDTVVTALVVNDPRSHVNVHFAYVTDARQSLVHTAIDGNIINATATQNALEDHLGTTPGRVLVHYNPETLSSLADPSVPGGVAAIDAIAEMLERHDLFAAPWVDLDEESLRVANETALVLDFYARGNATFEDRLGRTAAPIAWLDDNATAETLTVLRSAGITGLVVNPERIDELDTVRADQRPLQLLDSNGVPMPVLPIDRDFANRLISDDHTERSHQLLAEMLLLSESATTPRGFVLDLDTLDRSALDAFLAIADPVQRIRSSAVSTVLELAPARDSSGAILRTELDPVVSDGIGDAVTDLRLTESILDTYAEMVAPAQSTIKPLRDLLLTVMSADLTAEQRRDYTNAVFDAVEEGISGFEILESSRITLATRQAELPIVIRNSQPIPVTVRMVISSDKLRLPEGPERTVRLRPGDNSLALPVETVASGDARLTISLTSPDGQLDLTTGVVDIRSTAISGLGLIITFIAFVVLGFWWVRTILAVRRKRHAASVSAND